MTINGVYQELSAILVQKEKLDLRIKELRAYLTDSIPANESVDGVRHVVTTRRNVSYAEAVKRIIDLLVADSKKPRAWSWVEDHTKQSVVHSFRPAEDSLSMPSAEQEVS